MGCAVALVYVGAAILQPFGLRRDFEVATTDNLAKIKEGGSNGTHSFTTNTYNMYVLDRGVRNFWRHGVLVFGIASSWLRVARTPAASGFPRAREA